MTMTNKELYEELTRARYNWDPYKRDKDKGEDMEVLNEVIGQYWRERYLINHADKEAYELMGKDLELKFITPDDIDWESVDKLPNNQNAFTRSAYYPRFYVGKFEEGMALVQWTLYPDGMFFMDEDGYGMEFNEESAVYGIIDSHCKVLVPFQAKSWSEMEKKLSQLRKQRRKD